MRRINTHFAASLVCFFLFFLQAMSQSLIDCYRSENVSQNSSYLSNRDTVLSTLRNRSSIESYSNATAGLSQNTVYGMFLCRGDINKTSCSNCVNSTISRIYRSCFYHKEALVVSEKCIVRYSNSSFFILVENSNYFVTSSQNSSLDSPKIFSRTLIEELEKLIPTPSLLPYVGEARKKVNQSEGLYDLRAILQCSHDPDPRNCTICLRLVVQRLSQCCTNDQFALIAFPKCLITYNISALQSNAVNGGLTRGTKIYAITFIGIMITLVLPLMA